MRRRRGERGERERTTYLLQILQRRHIDSRLFKVEATAIDDLFDDALVNGTLRASQPCRSQRKEGKKLMAGAMRLDE